MGELATPQIRHPGMFIRYIFAPWYVVHWYIADAAMCQPRYLTRPAIFIAFPFETALWPAKPRKKLVHCTLQCTDSAEAMYQVSRSSSLYFPLIWWQPATCSLRPREKLGTLYIVSWGRVWYIAERRHLKFVHWYIFRGHLRAAGEVSLESVVFWPKRPKNSYIGTLKIITFVLFY